MASLYSEKTRKLFFFNLNRLMLINMHQVSSGTEFYYVSKFYNESLEEVILQIIIFVIYILYYWLHLGRRVFRKYTCPPYMGTMKYATLNMLWDTNCDLSSSPSPLYTPTNSSRGRGWGDVIRWWLGRVVYLPVRDLLAIFHLRKGTSACLCLYFSHAFFSHSYIQICFL